MTNIETFKKYLERRVDHGERDIQIWEVLNILEFMKDSESIGKVMVGIGYKRYDGEDINAAYDTDLYGGGFVAIKKQEKA